MVYMKFIYGIIVLIIALFIAGCMDSSQISQNVENKSTDGADQKDFPLIKEEVTMKQNTADNTTPKVLKVGQKTEITLKENPTTGYSWNITVTNGLNIIHDTFLGPENKRIVGGGGDHIWTIEATGVGNQTFSGVYQRSWEPPNENNTRFIREFMVIE